MNNSLFNFRDDEEREVFFIAIPVILLFSVLGYWLLGGNEPPAVTEINATVIDTDSDGVPDNSDQCVDRAGVLANAGCPAKIAYAQRDNDKDGIRNDVDSCPETKGDAANNGCRPGAVTGSIKEVAKNSVVASVAMDPIDSDGDLVLDINDQCPDTAANTATGCPADSDGDGVIDSADQCPEVAGTEIDLGCPPDADNDGVLGDADKCPDAAGSAIDNGCPADADGDGAMDMDDECPTVAGTANGCPADQDKDGISDDTDQCPTQAGTADLNGCPADTDGDGIADSEDNCPATAGAAPTGCPIEIDSDGDSVPDAVDQCPTIAGVTEAQGCPMDTDGDGIADADDQCPKVEGPIKSRGCPDTKPDTKVAATETISKQDQQILDAALAQVAFNTNSATLTQASRKILTEVAGLLKKYPDSKLEIRGHTDSSGAAARNMELSMQRARSCARYISQQGVDVTRLIAYGYGESQPIASNSTSAGKRTNRRVEFELKFIQ